MSGHEKGLRTPLKRVRGLGAAGAGVDHWWQTRLTSVALVPLTLWFVFAAVTKLAHGDYDHIRSWAANPINAVLLILFAAINFLHAASGIQAVLEDYVHKEGRKLVFIYAVKAVCLLLGAACVFSILKIAFTHS